MVTRLSLARLGSWCRDHRSDILAVSFIFLVAIAFFSPAIKDGFAYGGYDLDLSLTSLTRGAIASVHSPYNGDAVSQMVAWNNLDWQMIHHGQFPLWNQYSALGMPQFLNFESSVLSLPDLVSYLFPLTAAFWAVVVTKLVIAGTGVYLLGRVLRMTPVGALFSAVTFMLSGAFASWVTWPLSDVAAWSGWILAFAVMCYRSTGRARHVLGLGAAVALSVFGGFPEANVMFALVAGALVIVAGAVMVVRRSALEVHGLARTTAGVVLGVSLSAPLWFPGLQVIAAGHRTHEGHYAGLPLRSVPTIFTQGYFGMPIGSLRGVFQLSRWNYYETVSYVGIVALALALTAVISCWRRAVVVGLVAALVVSFALTYEPAGFHPVQSLLDHLGQLSTIRFERSRVFTGFVIALLAGFGVDRIVRAWSLRRTRWSLLGATAITAVFVVIAVADTAGEHLSSVAHTQRIQALVWPIVIAAMLLVASVVLARFARRLVARVVVIGCCAMQFVFLFFAGVGIPSYATTVYPVTPSVSKLQAIVGNSLVGLDGGNTTNVRSFAHIGFYPNVNIGYHVRIFGVHDPLVPTAYFSSWPFPAAAPENFGVGLFTPDINSVALARRYGISYVLAAPGLEVPRGMVEVADLAGERLLQVRGAAQFSFASNAEGSVTKVSTNDNGTYTVRVDATRTGQLVCRVTDLPGWHVTIDRIAVPIHEYDDVMLSIVVPKGTHEITLNYWPRRLSEGLAVAIGALVVFILATGTTWWRRRR